MNERTDDLPQQPSPHQPDVASRFDALHARLLQRDLDADGERQLRALADGDQARSAELAASDDLLDRFAAERSLRHAVDAELDGAAEASAELRALRAAADRGEALLRQQLRGGASRPVASRRLRWGAALAAAALFAAAVWLGGSAWGTTAGEGAGARRAAPGLLPDAPGGAVLGGRALLEIEPTLRRDDGIIRWSPVAGAARYAARLQPAGGDGELIATRDDLPASGSPSWSLDEAQRARLAAAAALPLQVEITAYDADGLPVVASGAVTVRLVD